LEVVDFSELHRGAGRDGGTRLRGHTVSRMLARMR
jgi:hypothetical protein